MVWYSPVRLISKACHFNTCSCSHSLSHWGLNVSACFALKQQVYRDSESTPMVCCDVCQRWVHCQCDGIRFTWALLAKSLVGVYVDFLSFHLLEPKIIDEYPSRWRDWGEIFLLVSFGLFFLLHNSEKIKMTSTHLLLSVHSRNKILYMLIWFSIDWVNSRWCYLIFVA